MFIQGLAISTGRILAMSVARDLFEKEELGKMMTNIMVVMGLAAIIFSILGGQIAQYFPWQWLFWIMVYFGSLIFLFTLFFYKETFNERNPNAVSPRYLYISWVNII
jgi:DHA1 family bicyclomycin/chloramphenicol resistance-like MFS transporter